MVFFCLEVPLVVSAHSPSAATSYGGGLRKRSIANDKNEWTPTGGDGAMTDQEEEGEDTFSYVHVHG